MTYRHWLFLQKSSLVDVWLVSKYAFGFRNSHRCSVEKVFLKHFANYSAFELKTSISLYQYLSVFSLNVGKKMKKNCGFFCFLWLWLLITIMKRCVEQCALELYCTSLLYVHSKSKVTENIFNLQEWHQNTISFISYKTFTIKKN